MNKILCFDTSANSCSVAVANGRQILSFEQELRPSMQAERLMVMIESALNSANYTYRDIDYVAVTTGPGSFTGIRIGIAAAKGIMHALNKKGLPINIFEYCFYRLKPQVKIFSYAVIVIDAYRDQQYVQVFDESKQVGEPRLVNNHEIKALFEKYNDTGTVACAGSGLAKIYDRIQMLKNLIILPRFPRPKADHLAKLADQKIALGSIEVIEPVYIRLPDAVPPKI